MHRLSLGGFELIFFAATLTACSIGKLDPTDKACPCAAPLVCMAGRCVSPNAVFDSGLPDSDTPDVWAAMDGAGSDGDETDALVDAHVPKVLEAVVVGAGPAGIAAALQIARMGHRVALLDEATAIGGSIGAAAHSTMEGYGQLRGAGIYSEFLERVREHYSSLGKSVATCFYDTDSVCPEPNVARDAIATMLAEELDIDLFLGTRITAILKEDVSGATRVVGVEAQRESGAALRFDVNMVIDASAYGDAVTLSGARFRAGTRESDVLDGAACVDPRGYSVVLRKYVAGAPPQLLLRTPPKGYTSAVRDEFAMTVNGTGASWRGPGSPTNLPVDWTSFVGYRGLPNTSEPGNYTAAMPDKITRTLTSWVLDVPTTVASLDESERVAALCDARLRALQFIYYVQNVLGEGLWTVADDEGFNESGLTIDCPDVPNEFEIHMPESLLVRESRRLIGLETLVASQIRRTCSDSLDLRTCLPSVRFSSAVAVGDYPMELAGCMSNSDLESGLETSTDLGENAPGRFQVPFGVFVPESVEGLLVAANNLSAGRLASSALRRQPTAFATGQAAGAIAAVALDRSVSARDLPPIAIQDALVESGSRIALESFDDVPVGSPYWEPVQIASVYGILPGVSSSVFDASTPMSRAQMAVSLAALLGLDTTRTNWSFPDFDDVPPTHPHYGDIMAIRERGITGGCTASLYCPDASIPRWQIALLITRAIPGLEIQEPRPAVDDIDSVIAGAQDAILVLLSNNVLDLCRPPASFCPDDFLLRGEAAAALRRLLSILATVSP